MKQYIVLQNIAPDQGPIIRPAGPDEPPVTVDETIVRGDTPEERAANVQKLIALGVIAPEPEPEPEPAATTTTARKAATKAEE